MLDQWQWRRRRGQQEGRTDTHEERNDKGVAKTSEDHAEEKKRDRENNYVVPHQNFILTHVVLMWILMLI